MSKLKPFSEFIKDTVELSWLIEDLLISGGTSLLIGDPKGGKSQFVRHLIASCLYEDSFMGRNVNGNKKVIYLALEEDSHELSKYLKSLNVQENETNLLIGSHNWLSENNLKDLEEDIKKHKPSLCIIDTFVAFSDLSDMNDYAKVYKPLQKISQIARSEQCHILIVHHKNKGESKGVKSTMGSQAFIAAVDATFVLSGEGEKKTIYIESRYTRNSEIAFSMTPYVLSGWSNSTNGLSCEEILLKAINQAGEEGLRLDSFKGHSKQSKQAAKKSLEQQGKIKTIGGYKGHPAILFINP